MNDELKKVSIIVPVYNMEKYLSRCLESITNQSYNNLDIIIINDGSTDNSQKIIDEYSLNDIRIRYIIKENGGYGSVLESALKQIKTEYFLICDPDDYLELDAIETLIEKSNNNDIVYGKYYNISDSDKEKTSYQSFFELIDGKSYTKDIDRFVFLPVSPHAKLYKTELFNGIVFPKNIYFTDVLLFYYALSKANNIVYVDKYLANYYSSRLGNTQTDNNPIIYNYHEELINNIVSQCDIINNKYMALGILFYNLYTMIKLSNNSDNVIDDKKECIYKMFEHLMPFNDLINEIPEISEELKRVKNKLLDKDYYKKTIDLTLMIRGEAQKLFVDELNELNRVNRK